MVSDALLTRLLADNFAVATAPPKVVIAPLLVTKALEFNYAIIFISPLTIKMLVLVRKIFEVKPEAVESTLLIVAPDMPLARPHA